MVIYFYRPLLSSERFIRRHKVCVGVIFSIAASSLYFWRGYSLFMLGLWFIGLLVTALGLKAKDKTLPQGAAKLRLASDRMASLNKPSRHKISNYGSEFIMICGLLVICIPLYLAYLHSLPIQVNADEVTIMSVQKSLASTPHVDLFGLSSYAGLPSLIFIVMGKLGIMLGGVTLYHMRLIHALSGLLIVVVGYVFFRQNLSRRWAFVAAAILGTNHSLLMISRMAMRENTALLIELVALTCLYVGFKHRSRFWTFIGGAAAGMSFYTYFPSRITIAIYFAFIVGWIVCFTPKKERFKLIKLGGIGLLGMFMVVTPYAIASSKDFNSSIYHPRQQILLYPEGRKLQQNWVSADSQAAAYKLNIKNGLSVFNNNIYDYGYIYPNMGHGFVDPLSGVLIWLGLLIVLWRFFHRSSRQAFDFLIVIGFLTIWLILALVINKAPNYTRLLVILPFTAYFITSGLQSLARLVSKLTQYIHLRLGTPTRTIVVVFGLISIIGWNLLIAGDFIKQGRAKGDNIGTTARYIEARANQPSYHFYLASDSQYPYYSWGDPHDQWERWMGFFATPSQTVQALSPQDRSMFGLAQQQFTIFMDNDLWAKNENTFKYYYPKLHKHLITPDGQLLAIEVDGS